MQVFKITSLTEGDRRARLLNIMLVGTGMIVIIAFVAAVMQGTGPRLYGVILVVLIALGGIFIINRRGRVALAGGMFLTILTLALLMADSPQEVIGGRTLFMFVIPILMASFLLSSHTSFIIASGITIVHIIIANIYDLELGPYGLLAFFVVAMISWLAASSLESALNDLRSINIELDQRVEQRTQELAEANHELVAVNERLTELDQLKSKFVSDVSHELRTPISNLVIYLEMLEKGFSNPERRARYLTVLQDETKRLATLVTDVLDTARMELRSTEMTHTDVDLVAIIERVVIANQLQADAKGLALICEVGELPLVWGDADQLNQIVNNLIGNAVKYTAKGEIKVSAHFNNNQLVFRVQDTGLGIAPDDLPHIFSRFYRGALAAQSAIPGTGLGLAITKEIVTAHEGRIHVESEVGRGSTFTIYLPNKEIQQ